MSFGDVERLLNVRRRREETRLAAVLHIAVLWAGQALAQVATPVTNYC